MYLSPNTPIDKYQTFVDTFEEVLSKYNDIKLLLFGDFNLPNLEWIEHNGKLHPQGTNTNKSTLITSTLCDYHSLFQLNNIRNVDNKILDLVFTNFKLSNVKLSDASDPLPINIDQQHPPLDIYLTIEKKKPSKKNFTCQAHKREEKIYCFKDGNYIKLSEDINKVDWNTLFRNTTNIDEAITLFYSFLEEKINENIPSKIIKDFKFPEWTTPELKNLILEKKRIHKKFKQTRSQDLNKKFKELRRQCKIKSEEDYKEFNRSKENQINNHPEKFWKYIKSKKQNNDLPSEMTFKNEQSNDSQTIANMFASNFASVYSSEQLASPSFCFENTLSEPMHNIIITKSDIEKELKSLKNDSSYGPDNIPPILLKNCANAISSPLFILFNKSLTSGKFPNQWKTSFVIPIYKNSGDRKQISNYRGICKTSAIPKLLEHLIYKQISKILYPLISHNQHGFLPKKSTTTNLLSFTDYVNNCINEGTQFDCITTDYAKAFDKINVNILCAKFEALGIKDPLLSWMYNYFSNRTQIVKLKTTQNNAQCECYNNLTNNNFTEYLSEPFEVLSGCPQGGHLSGLAFNIYINDIYTFLSTKFWLFADDNKTGLPIRNSEDANILQNSLNSLYEWCLINKMELNISKCKQITFHRKSQPIEHQYTINNIPLEKITEIKDLGVTFNHKLSFNQHYENISKKAYKTLGFINRNSKEFQNPKTYITLYNTFVRPILEYASSVWSPYYAKYQAEIESVQHKFLRNLSYKQHRPMDITNHNYSDIMTYNNIISLQHRRDVIDIIFLFKILNNMTWLQEFLEKIQFRIISHNTRNKSLFYEKQNTKNYVKNMPIHRMVRLFNIAAEKDPSMDLFNDNIIQLRSKLVKIEPFY